jgi:hypothetical protein
MAQVSDKNASSGQTTTAALLGLTESASGSKFNVVVKRTLEVANSSAQFFEVGEQPGSN